MKSLILSLAQKELIQISANMNLSLHFHRPSLANLFHFTHILNSTETFLGCKNSARNFRAVLVDAYEMHFLKQTH